MQNFEKKFFDKVGINGMIFFEVFLQSDDDVLYISKEEEIIAAVFLKDVEIN